MQTKSPKLPMRLPFQVAPRPARRLRSRAVRGDGDGVEAVPVHRQAGEIDREDGAGPLGDRGFDALEIDVARYRIDVDEHRTRTHSRMTLAVATQESGVVMTSSPGSDAGDAQRDLQRQVPELKARTGRPPK